MAICGLPFLLGLAGVDFSPKIHVFVRSGLDGKVSQGAAEVLPLLLQGSFTAHTLLEWSAVSTALFTVLLACISFQITGNLTALVMGVSLLGVGALDAFHTWTASGLLVSLADSTTSMPFSWVVYRFCNGLIMLAGAILCLTSRPKTWPVTSGIALVTGLCVAGLAYGIIDVGTSGAHRPQTMFPASLIPRPYDLAPLLIFLVTGAFVYPRLHRHD